MSDVTFFLFHVVQPCVREIAIVALLVGWKPFQNHPFPLYFQVLEKDLDVHAQVAWNRPVCWFYIAVECRH